MKLFRCLMKLHFIDTVVGDVVVGGAVIGLAP